jgi:RNA polymerase subunit RPABC4/transcription elongation factor Spt4
MNTLINCPACHFPMSKEASVCPNCHKPRDIGYTKVCIKCGKEMSSQKKKCPECGALQSQSSKRNNSSMTNKNKNYGITIILSVVFFIIGVIGAYFYLQQNPIYKQSWAEVNKVNGVYVYFKSTPLVGFNSLGTVTNDFVGQAGEAIKGKKLVKAIGSLVTTSKENMDCNKLINSMTKKAKETYENADAVIFNDNLSSCEVVAYK